MCIALATTKENHLSITEYYSKMRSLADDMASTVAALRDDELVSYILVGLNEEYNFVYTVVVTRVEPITPSELYAQLLGFEQHLQLQSGGTHASAPSTHAASCGRGASRGRSRGASHSGFNDNRTSSSNSRPQCQVCFKIRHTTAMRFDEDFILEPHTIAVASNSFGSNNN
jgi:hypothetical protein